MKKDLFVINELLILCLLISQLSFANENKYLFKEIKEDKEMKEFIKLHQRSVIDNPNLEDTKIARFAVGEYYFKHNNLFDSRNVFKKYVNDYPPQISTFIAKIFLFKIAKLLNNIEAIEALKKEIFDKSFIILFSDYKVLKYTSLFGNNYTVHYYINKVEVFINGQFFEKIEP